MTVRGPGTRTVESVPKVFVVRERRGIGTRRGVTGYVGSYLEEVSGERTTVTKVVVDVTPVRGKACGRLE